MSYLVEPPEIAFLQKKKQQKQQKKTSRTKGHYTIINAKNSFVLRRALKEFSFCKSCIISIGTGWCECTAFKKIRVPIVSHSTNVIDVI